MLVEIVFLMGIIAAGVSWLTLSQLGEGRSLNEIYGGLIGVVSWGVFSLGAMNAEVVTDSGTVVSRSHPGVAGVGVMLAGIMLLVALFGVTAIVDVRDIEGDVRP